MGALRCPSSPKEMEWWSTEKVCSPPLYIAAGCCRGDEEEKVGTSAMPPLFRLRSARNNRSARSHVMNIGPQSALGEEDMKPVDGKRGRSRTGMQKHTQLHINPGMAIRARQCCYPCVKVCSCLDSVSVPLTEVVCGRAADSRTTG